MDLEKFIDNCTADKDEINQELLADDIRWNINGSTTIIGKKNFLEAIKMKSTQLNISEDDFSVVGINDVTIKEEYIVIENAGMIFRKDGQAEKIKYFDIYRIKEGKIREMITFLP